MRWTGRKQQYCDHKNSMEQDFWRIVQVVNVSEDFSKTAERRGGNQITCFSGCLLSWVSLRLLKSPRSITQVCGCYLVVYNRSDNIVSTSGATHRRRNTQNFQFLGGADAERLNLWF